MVASQSKPTKVKKKPVFYCNWQKDNDFIKGVVGWIDLRAENLEARLEYFSQYEKLKGFRHIVQGESEVDFLLREDFCAGISKLAKYNFTYDLLIFPTHLPYATALVKRFPQQSFGNRPFGKTGFQANRFCRMGKRNKRDCSMS